MLNRSLALDPSYAPAWQALATWYGSTGGLATAVRRLERCARRRGTPRRSIPKRGLPGGESVLRQFALARSPMAGCRAAKRIAKWRICCAGGRQRAPPLPDELAACGTRGCWMKRRGECDAVVLIDAQDAGARSCGVTFMQRGDIPAGTRLSASRSRFGSLDCGCR